MNTEDRIKKAHIALSRDDIWCAYSVILACGETIVTKDKGPTACTDGWTKWYNPDFVEEQNDAQLRGLVLHENTHAMAEHLYVWKHLWDENPMLANIAMDHFVNLSIMDTDKGRGFIALPEKGIQPDPQYRGMNVQQIYDRLKQELKDRPKPKDGQPEPGGEGEDEGAGGEGVDNHDFEGASKRNSEERAKQSEEIKNAMRQGEAVRRTRGQGKGGANGMFDALLNSKTDWRKLLREFIQSHCA